MAQGISNNEAVKMIDETDDCCELEETANEMATQLSLLEEANKEQWKNVEEIQKQMLSTKTEANLALDKVAHLQKSLLCERQRGDRIEANRLSAEAEERNLKKTNGSNKKVSLQLHEVVLSTRIEAERGLADNQNDIMVFDQFRKRIIDKTFNELELKIKTAQVNGQRHKELLEKIKFDVQCILKQKESLMVSCDTYDQALENVLRETKEEYFELNRAKQLSSALQKDQEIATKRSEALRKQCRSAESMNTALKKQAADLGIMFTNGEENSTEYF